jgi:hypothetical protein
MILVGFDCISGCCGIREPELCGNFIGCALPGKAVTEGRCLIKKVQLFGPSVVRGLIYQQPPMQ